MILPNGVLLDTNVLSYLLRQSPLGAYYERQRAGQVAYVACASLEELYFGAAKRKWGDRKRKALDTFITEYVALPADIYIARISARLRAERERAGRALDKADAWIAATALDYNLQLFTHDGDFQGIDGLHIVTALNSRVEGADAQDSAGKDALIGATAFEPSIYLLH